MPGRNFRLQDYSAYLEKVGEATYIDCTRRTDPARVPEVWENLKAVVDSFGPPWVLQLWTKDPAGVVKVGGGMIEDLASRGTTVTCQLTVTGLAGSPLEPNVPPGAFEAAAALVKLIGGPGHVAWRFDPLIPGLENVKRFEALVPKAAELGITRLVINFVCDPGKYKRADRRLEKVFSYWRQGLPGIDPEWKEKAARQIVEIAGRWGLDTYACAEGRRLCSVVPGLGRPSCGSFDWFCELSGKAPPRPAARGSRGGCGCAAYFDVGSYGSWSRCHRCLYCYAG